MAISSTGITIDGKSPTRRTSTATPAKAGTTALKAGSSTLGLVGQIFGGDFGKALQTASSALGTTAKVATAAQPLVKPAAALVSAAPPTTKSYWGPGAEGYSVATGPATTGSGPSVTPQAPTGTTTAPPPGNVPSIGALQSLSAAELDAALAAIESQYGLTREQLLADQSELGSTYRFLFSNLERQRQSATQGATGEALQRGILRSGIHQGNIADVEQQFAEQSAQAEAAKQARLFQINQALAALGPQQALAEAQAASQISGSQLALEQQLAALGQLAPQAAPQPAQAQGQGPIVMPTQSSAGAAGAPAAQQVAGLPQGGSQQFAQQWQSPYAVPNQPIDINQPNFEQIVAALRAGTTQPLDRFDTTKFRPI